PTPVAEDIINGQYVPINLMPSPPLNKPINPKTSKLRYCKYVGTINVCGGTKIVKITSAKSIFLPLKLKRANPYPTNAHAKVVNNIVLPESTNEFHNTLKKSIVSITNLKFSNVILRGIYITVVSYKSALSLKAMENLSMIG